MGGGCTLSISPCWPLHTYPQRVVNGRGVTRLDGARGKKHVWRPHVRAWGLSQENVLYWWKYLWLVGTFRRSTQSFGASIVIRRPGTVPPCSPGYAPRKRALFSSRTPAGARNHKPFFRLEPDIYLWSPILTPKPNLPRELRYEQLRSSKKTLCSGIAAGTQFITPKITTTLTKTLA